MLNGTGCAAHCLARRRHSTNILQLNHRHRHGTPTHTMPQLSIVHTQTSKKGAQLLGQHGKATATEKVFRFLIHGFMPKPSSKGKQHAAQGLHMHGYPHGTTHRYIQIRQVRRTSLQGSNCYKILMPHQLLLGCHSSATGWLSESCRNLPVQT